MLQLLADRLDVRGGQFSAQRVLQFAADFDVVEVAITGQQDLVSTGQTLIAQNLLLDLGREDIDATHNQHVVGTAGDLADATERT